MDKGKLFVVSTPIGNLEDITIRAVKILRNSDIIVCESIKKSRILLEKYGISVPLKRYWDKNKERVTVYVISKIKEGKNVSLITDAGTPSISDPGYYLIRECIKAGIEIVPVPGPSALLAALVVSGLPTDRFTFYGFLGRKKGKREKELKEIMTREETVIVYESVHRIERLIEEISEIDENREIAVCREMTKIHESVYRGKAKEVKEKIKGIVKKGEFVVIIGGKE